MRTPPFPEKGQPLTDGPLFLRSDDLRRCPLGPLGSSSSQHRRTPEIVLLKGHASFRITSGPPVQRIAVTG